MAVNTAYLCVAEGCGIQMLEYRSLDGLAVVPEEVGGKPVTALQIPYEKQDLKTIIEAANREGNKEAVSLLMDKAAGSA